MILRKFLKDKGLWFLTLLVYLLIIAVILWMAYSDKRFADLDMNDINEKNINLMYVLTSNIWLITKNIIIGFATFGMYPLFSIVQNVIALGMISNSLIHSGYIRLFYKLIPHGCIELLGISISFATVIYCLFKFVIDIPKIVKKEKKMVETLIYTKNIVINVFIIELCIFTIAAIIETAISHYKMLD